MAELSVSDGALPVASCCTPEKQADCCAPSEKATCCPPEADDCGCQSSAEA